MPERHAGLCLDDMAEIVSLSRTENHTELKIKHDNTFYIVQIPEMNDNILRAGLSWLYGYGHLKYNYDLSVFQTIAKNDLEECMELAVEIWERNIHQDWMKKLGYETHNGTKDYPYLYEMIKNKQKAIETHRKRSDHQEKGDTPHHIFRNPEVLRVVIESEGEDDLSKYLTESFYDQATATTRYWYKLKKEYEHLTFEERLIDNMEKGYYIAPETDTEIKIKRWKRGVFGFTNDYETELWQLWFKVHDKFKEYWIDKFGKNEELWQPPAPIEILKK